MKVAIIGGKLQGTEAVYLASACGFESILIDSNPQVPAAGLAGRFVCGDITAEDDAVIAAMMEADFVLPANENDQVLEAVCRICKERKLPLAFDKAAYEITKSKKKSDKLFLENGIPAPRYYPDGKAPYIMKPSGESGSAGVTYAETRDEAETFLAACPDPENWIVQEYLEGPSYSIEVIGVPGNYRTYAVTQIHMDDVYDCCKVTCPCSITKAQEEKFALLGKRLAELVNLHGIMDVEVIDDGEDFKVLEIDARIPSQTPIAVLYASGMNELSDLGDIIVKGKFETPQKDFGRYSVYEHYLREDGVVRQEGEHMMASCGPLDKRADFAGSRISLLDKGENGNFRGIFVNWADTKEELEAKRAEILRNLKTLP
ncbi:3-methylornithine--L-lysine ligase PylC [Anaerovoracaceae bacterium 42-11]